jgi:DcuC family C4-dicarboxylate transporter
MPLAWEDFRLSLGIAVIFLAIYAIYRRLEVRLTLLIAALLLGTLAGDPSAIVKKFLTTFTNEQFVIPICTAMGFAYVIRHTQCDQHLVHLLLRPIEKVRFLLIPGTVVVGFLVNMPVVSQTSSAVTIGTVVIPLLLAARLSPVTIGAALLLGCSIGGELLNPGAPELRTTLKGTRDAADKLRGEADQRLAQNKNLPGLQREADEARRRATAAHELTSADCVQRIVLLDFLGLAVATALFWWLSSKEEKKIAAEDQLSHYSPNGPPDATAFKVNLVKALVPLVPLFLLYLISPPFQVIEVPVSWLEDPEKGKQLAEGELQKPTEKFETRLIGAAMLIGAAIAALVVWRKSAGVALAFFEGAGFGFTHIISLIVVASCFGTGIELIGIARAIGDIIHDVPELLLPAAGMLSLGFGVLCGSGMATAQSLFGFFAEAAYRVGVDPVHVGAVVSLGAAAGRTLSPVAAVTLMCAGMTKTDPIDLLRRLALPILAGMTAVVIAAILLATPA